MRLTASTLRQAGRGLAAVQASMQAGALTVAWFVTTVSVRRSACRRGWSRTCPPIRPGVDLAWKDKGANADKGGS